jgi:dTDP-4-amino-4,6-dideoxygalactose transaminase
VIEDACQAWLAEYKGRMCGTIGDLGCFSFQNSKHLPSGEGGAITGNSDDLMDRAGSFHDCGRPYGGFKGGPNFTRGGNFRMQHVQAAMLLPQIGKLRDDTARRRQSAARLSALLKAIPGIVPARLPDNSQAVWHLYPFRYDADRFQGLSREQFLRAMRAEGIPCSAGYREQYLDGLVDEAIASRGFKRLFGERRLQEYRDSFRELKGNRQVCATTVGIPQNLLLAAAADVDRIAEAIRKIQAHGAELARA